MSEKKMMEPISVSPTNQDHDRHDRVTEIVQIMAVLMFVIGIFIFRWFAVPLSEDAIRNIKFVFFGAAVFIMVPLTLRFFYRWVMTIFG